MIVSIFKDNISEHLDVLHKKAKEARERGDMDGFYNYSREALDIVSEWIDRQKCREKNLSGFFLDSIRQNDRKQTEIAFGELRLAVKKVEIGLGEPKFNLRELNGHLTGGLNYGKEAII